MSQFCPKCGTQNVNEAKFCKSCGFNLAEAAEQLKKEKAAQAAKKSENLDKPTFVRESQNDKAENQRQSKKTDFENYANNRIKEIEKELNQPSNTEERTTNFIFFILVLLAIFIIIAIASSSNQSSSEYSSSTNTESSDSQIAEETPTPESEAMPEVNSNQDIEYFNKSQALWDNKKGQYKNPKKVIEYLTKAIEINQNKADYFNSRGVAYNQIKKYKKAETNYNQAIKLQPNNAIYIQNRGSNYTWLEKWDLAKADGKKACQLGQCQLKKDLENILNDREENTLMKSEISELDKFTEECNAGNARSCNNAGSIYFNGEGVVEDKRKAYKLFEKSCNGRNKVGCHNLGGMYALGVGTEINTALAAEIYKDNCNRNYANSCYALGVCYEFGKGVTEDAAEAMRLYKKGCDLGFAEACNKYNQ